MERARVSHLSRFHRHTEPSAAQEAMLSAEGGSERVACGWNTIAPVRSLWPAGEKKSHELERAAVYVSVKFHLGLAISHVHQHVQCLVTFTSLHREWRQKLASSPVLHHRFWLLTLSYCKWQKLQWGTGNGATHTNLWVLWLVHSWAPTTACTDHSWQETGERKWTLTDWHPCASTH